MYKIRGADQKEYGPISAEQVRQWIAENRLNRYSLCEGGTSPGWRPLSQFPEFEESLRTSSPPPPPSSPTPTTPADQAATSNPPHDGTPAPSPTTAPSPTAGTFPTATASVGAYFPSGGPDSAAQAIQGPAIGLMVCGILGIVMALAGIPLNLMGIGFGPVPNFPDENTRQMYEWVMSASRPFGIISSLIGIGWNAFIVWGSIRMKKLEAHNISLIASILTVIPCFSACCCISIPVGIWALVVLNRPDVRPHFRG